MVGGARGVEGEGWMIRRVSRRFDCCHSDYKKSDPPPLSMSNKFSTFAKNNILPSKTAVILPL